MHLDEKSKMNAQVVARLVARGGGEPGPAIVSPKEATGDPYMGMGCHPDCVARVWEPINKALPVDCRCVVYGVPALVSPKAGVILAMAWGTQYLLRLPEGALPLALAQGASLMTKWSDGTTSNASAFGHDWVWGFWSKDEPRWCREVFDAVEG